MAVLQAPVANFTYTVNGHSYTSGQDGRFTCTDAGDLALLRAMGINPYIALPDPPSGSGGGTGMTHITLDMG
jgi:hypothetical protein